MAFEIGRGRESVAAVVDVSAGACGVAIIATSKNVPARVLASGVSALALEEHTPEQHRAAISTHIQGAGELALKRYAEGGHRSPIHAVYAVIHAPWANIVARASQKTKFPHETRVTDALIGSLAQETLRASGIDHARLLEATVIRVILNGYTTAQPSGKYAHDIEAISLISTDEAGVREAVHAAIEKLFPVSEIVWRSFTRALISVFREASASGQYLAVDMRADATALISYRYGVLEQRTVPVGVSSVLAKLGATDPNSMLSSLRMLARDACATEECERVQQALAKTEPDLVRLFGEAMGQLAVPRRVSNDLFLVTHPDLESWLAHFFARLDFSQFTTTTLPFNVHTPSSIAMTRFVDGDLPDVALTVDAALLNIERGE